MTQHHTLHDMEGTPLAEAEVRTLSEGDLCIDLSSYTGKDLLQEKVIILVEARENGTFQVRFLTPDASLISEVIVP